jgi:hypothetical protein
MHYFAYGSNMSTRRLQARLPHSEPLGYAWLRGYEVVFHKRGYGDASGKCGLLTADNNALAHGVEFAIRDEDQALLDTIEGVGHGYRCHEVVVEHGSLGVLTCLTYLATVLDESLRPFHWYRQHVITGAREHGLPADYQRRLKALPVIDDPDVVRHQRELAIYATDQS